MVKKEDFKCFLACDTCTDILQRLKFVGFFEPDEFQGLCRSQSCLFGGISAPLAYIPVCMQSGYAIHLSTAMLNEAGSYIPNYDTESRRFQERESIMPQGQDFSLHIIRGAEHKKIKGFALIPPLKRVGFPAHVS